MGACRELGVLQERKAGPELCDEIMTLAPAFPATFTVLSGQRGGTFLARRWAHFSRTQGLGTASLEMSRPPEHSLRELTE